MTEHISETTQSEPLIALREMQPTPSPPIGILVDRTPPPQLSIEDRMTELEYTVNDVREKTDRLDRRVASLETTVDGLSRKVDTNHDFVVGKFKAIEDRMDESDRRIDGRFDEIKRWADVMAGFMVQTTATLQQTTATLQTMMEKMQVSLSERLDSLPIEIIRLTVRVDYRGESTEVLDGVGLAVGMG